ncbi:RRN3 family protein [Abortiporus biennis]
MDPHSRFSQYNSRQPKIGPAATDPRYMMESSVKTQNPLENYKKKSATNSRIKQDEQVRKDMHLAFVSNALQQKVNGDSSTFDQLVDQFNLKKAINDSPSPSPSLRLWIQALSNVVSRLERCHLALIETVVGMPWTTMDNAFVKSYSSFIGHLVSAKPEYLSLVLGNLAHGLTYHSGLQALDAGFAESSSNPLTRRVVYDRIHLLLRHLISLVPTLPSALQPLLVRHFPHKRQNQAAQVTYIRNIMRVIEYCPELTDRILATVVDRAIQIDVEIQVELEELEDHPAEHDEVEVFDLDPFDTVVGQEGSKDSDDDSDSDGDNLSDISTDSGDDDDSDDDTPEIRSDLKHIQEMVNKLDAILNIVFDHFSKQHPSLPIPDLSTSDLNSPNPSARPTRPPSPSTTEREIQLRRSQFYTLLSIFDRIILKTFKSRYTQFLIFWYSSLDPEFSDTFQGMLVSKALLEQDQPAVTRAAAASYIASFVSRAQFVNKESTRQVVACLCNYLKNQLELFDGQMQMQVNGSIFNVANYGVFYAVTQAVFLIFCFRWRDLMKDEDVLNEMANEGNGPISKWMPELDVLKRVIMSELNPLKICASNVVMQFAKVAHSTDFLYCYSLIEANRRSEFAPKTDNSGSSRPRGFSLINPAILGGDKSVQIELNTFFPFDPYRLPRSSTFIEGIYRDWSSVAIESDDEDDDEDEEEEGSEEESEDEHDVEDVPFGAIAVNGVRPKDEADCLDASFGGMSISPMRPAMSGVPMSVS